MSGVNRDASSTPDRNDELESFLAKSWHVLLWVTLRRREHELSFPDIVDSLRRLGHMYLDETGKMRGGFYSCRASSIPWALRTDFLATCGHDSCYHTSSKHWGKRKVGNIWQMVRYENPHLQESPNLEDKLDRPSMNWIRHYVLNFSSGKTSTHSMTYVGWRRSSRKRSIISQT